MNNLDALKQNIFSVSEFLGFVSGILAPLSGVKVQGEILSVNRHPTGTYVTLKDATGEDGALTVYVTPFAHKFVPFDLEEGLEVVVTGMPAFFKRKGGFYLRLEKIELAGEGALKKQYDLLKAKLTEEGLFDRKRELPEFIQHIGLITAKTGAVIDDFRKNLMQAGITISHIDVRVEGTQGEIDILSALKTCKKLGASLDVIVIIRGGGGKDDLSVFNSESICREVFASKVPVIAAIGHDRDVPLVQLCADAAVSTPTAAAVLVNSSWDKLNNLDTYTTRLLSIYKELLFDTEHMLANSRRILESVYTNFENKVKLLSQRLQDLNPETILNKGYAIVLQDGKVVKSKHTLTNQPFTVRMHDGEVNAQKII